MDSLFCVPLIVPDSHFCTPLIVLDSHFYVFDCNVGRHEPQVTQKNLKFVSTHVTISILSWVATDVFRPTEFVSWVATAERSGASGYPRNKFRTKYGSGYPR